MDVASVASDIPAHYSTTDSMAGDGAPNSVDDFNKSDDGDGDAQLNGKIEIPTSYPETDPNAPPLESDEVMKMAKSVMEEVISNRFYKFAMVSHWTYSINTQVLSKLRLMDSRNKYIVSTVVVQESRAGLNSKTTCYWNNDRDRYVIARYSNKYVNSLVNIYIIPL